MGNAIAHRYGNVALSLENRNGERIPGLAGQEPRLDTQHSSPEGSRRAGPKIICTKPGKLSSDFQNVNTQKFKSLVSDARRATRRIRQNGNAPSFLIRGPT